jgi:hypothetical protein
VNAETWSKPFIAAMPDWLLEALGYGTANGHKKGCGRKKTASSNKAKTDDEVNVNTGDTNATTDAPESSTSATETDLIREGLRNLHLTSMAGHMRKAGFDEDAIRVALVAVNEARCVPPLDAEEVETIARSVASYEPDPLANIIFKGVTPPNSAHNIAASSNGDSTTNGNIGTGGTSELDTLEIVRIPASQLVAAVHTEEWLWKGYMAKGGITLFSALWKIGKTVLLAHGLKALGKGGQFCGQDIAPGRALIVTEESQALWAGRRDKLSLGDWCEFVIQPFAQKPSVNDWARFINGLAKSLSDNPADLVVFDPLTHLWPVRDENNASEVTAALMPLRLLNKETGCNLTLVHHLRKSDGDQATGSRGSGALAAFVDTILEMRRYEVGGKDRRRVLTAHGRYDDTPAEIVVELSEDGTSYSAGGTKVESKIEDAIAIILKMLPTTAPGMTRKEIADQWPEEATMPRTEAFGKALEHGITVGFWQRSGEGIKNDPHRYYRTPRPA